MKKSNTSKKGHSLVSCGVIGLLALFQMSMLIFVWGNAFSHFIPSAPISSNAQNSNAKNTVNMFSDEYDDIVRGQAEYVDAVYRVEYLDVGQGDATVITSGEHTLLIDVGSQNDGRLIADHLASSGIEYIDCIVCTNTESDHVGGLSAILSKLNVGKIYVMRQYANDAALSSCLAQAKQHGSQIVMVGDDEQVWDIGSIECHILSATNNIIMRASIGEFRFMFMSDATAEEEWALAERSNRSEITIAADVLKASAHGAANTSTEFLLNEVSAKYAIISCDEDICKYDSETMNRLCKTSITTTIHDTGTVLIETDGHHFAYQYVDIFCDGD